MNKIRWPRRATAAVLLSAMPLVAMAAELSSFVLRPNKPLNAVQLEKFETDIRDVFKVPEVDRQGRSLKEIVNELCGTATEDRMAAITAMNSDLTSSRVRVPACIRWTRETIAPLPKNSAPVTFARGRNAVLASIPANANALPIGADIHLKNLTHASVSLTLTDVNLVGKLSATMSEFDVSLLGEEDPGVGDAYVEPVNVEPVPLEANLGSDDRAQCDPAKPDWPYSIPEVVKILRFYKDYRAEKGPTIAFVADTGLPLERVEDFALHRIQAPDTDPPPQLWGRHVSPMVNGGPDRNPRSPDIASYSQAEHGLAVASIASGRQLFAESGIDPNLWVNLFIHSVLFSTPNGYVGSDVSAFENSLSASPTDLKGVNRIPIINISWSFNAKSETFENLVMVTPALLVVAAGNDGELDVALGNSYPAVLGESDNVIVVAGYGKDKRKLNISAAGQEVVSIAAPGCALPILRSDGTAGLGHGTSVAAPLVTFTASIVHGLGVQRASAIKERILMTADHEAKLDPFVFEGRMLNVPHAIAVGHDLIRWNDSARLGLLQAPPKSIVITDGVGPATTVPWEAISRLRVERTQNGSVSVMARVKTKNSYRNRPAKPDGLLGLKFTDWEGVLQEIPADVSFEIVPRSRPIKFAAPTDA